MNRMISKRVTARSRLVAALVKEISGNSASQPYAIESEYTLCEKYGLSRVTVRLALSDLERKGLIYKEHGRGTFAYGRRGLASFKAEATFPNDEILSKTIRARNAVEAMNQFQTEFLNYDWDRVEKVTIVRSAK